MSIPLATAASPTSVLLASLLLIAIGLLAMLLPQDRLRHLLRGRDPANVGMCTFALGLATCGLLLVTLATASVMHGNGPMLLATACGAVLLVAATDLLRTALGFKRMPAMTMPARWRARVLLALIARR